MHCFVLHIYSTVALYLKAISLRMLQKYTYTSVMNPVVVIGTTVFVRPKQPRQRITLESPFPKQRIDFLKLILKIHSEATNRVHLYILTFSKHSLYIVFFPASWYSKGNIYPNVGEVSSYS